MIFSYCRCIFLFYFNLLYIYIYCIRYITVVMLLYKSMLFFIQKFEALLSSQMLNLVDRVLTKTPFGLTVVVLPLKFYEYE